MQKTLNIAIDGPSGSGKSTIAKLIAKKLGIIYLDTGAMFRALALKVIKLGIKADDEAKIKAMLENTSCDVKYENGNMQIFLDDEDVTGLIRENSVSKYASDISALKIVRDKLIGLQREIAENNDVILDGRDIGTVVLPNANYKFFLTADSLERAKRRHLELKEKGQDIAVEELKKQIDERDYNDSHREVAPLKCADDAVMIDSTSLSIDEVLQVILDKIGG